MIYDYVVYLKNERGRSINLISCLLASISAIFFLLQRIRHGRETFIFLISFLLIVAALMWNWYNFSKKRKPVHYSRILLVAGVTWFAMPFMQWLGIFLVLLSLLEKHARLPLEIGFTNDKIVFNTIFRRKFYWNEFNNVLLKDGLLTIDFKNNNLFQKITIDDEGDADEEEFNEYCSKQLIKNRGM